MYEAVLPFADVFITPMAAVAGAVAEEMLAAMTGAAELARAYVNNGGDIALHLAPGEAFRRRHDRSPGSSEPLRHGCDPRRGPGARHRHERLARPQLFARHRRRGHHSRRDGAGSRRRRDRHRQRGRPARPPGLVRQPARDLQPDSDLGDILVTRDVGGLAASDIDDALEHGEACAEHLLAAGLIASAALHLQGTTRTVGLASPSRAMREGRVSADANLKNQESRLALVMTTGARVPTRAD